LTRSLSIHARYRCQHRGACCTSDWPIPVEADRLVRLQAALASGALRLERTADVDVFIESAEAPVETPAIIGTVDRRCVFYDHAGQRCAVHRALGHEALPLACRQFPRVTLHDPRGVAITLSHYCPTAASWLDNDAPVTIVADPPAFPAAGEYVGLDATSSLPPLLRPDVLMDWNSWWEWERLSVQLLTADEPAEKAISRLGIAVEHARAWRPNDRPLAEQVRDSFDRARQSDAPPVHWSDRELAHRRAEMLSAMPPDMTESAVIILRASSTSGAVSRLLAAHAFANWTAHLGRGLRTWLRSVEAPLVLIQSGMDVRTVDLWLRHLVDPKRLAEKWSEVEV